tara:strand:- start:12 stop:494 length:483 start_codon:yes stop_codon:yes gene_type:complete
MNNKQKKQLKQIIKENDVKDNTRMLRKNRKSSKLKNEVDIIQGLKIQYNVDELIFKEQEYNLKEKCPTLYKEYSNIYTKLLRNEIDVNILYTFLDELEKIEKGTVNQHEASYNIGVLLKSLYVDKELKILEENNTKTDISGEKMKNGKKLTYDEYLKTTR